MQPSNGMVSENWENVEMMYAIYFALGALAGSLAVLLWMMQ